MLQAYDVVKDDVAVIGSRLASPGDHRRDAMQRDAMQRDAMQHDAVQRDGISDQKLTSA